MRKILPFVLTVVVLIALGGGYWSIVLREKAGADAHTDAPPPGVVVEATPAIRATSVRKLKAIGTLASNQSVVIRPEIPGRVTQIHFDDGATVEQGALLLQLDKSVLLAELADAESALNLAKLQDKRAKRLLQKGAGTERARDEAEAALRSNQARVQLAQAQLEKCDIRAPFDGKLGIRRIDLGAYLSAGDDVVNLEQTTPIKIGFEVPERFLTDLQVGKQVALRTDAYAGEIFAAEINAVDPLINQRTRGVKVQAIAQNGDGRLRPGQFVSVTLRVDERRGATFVPQQALVPNSDQPFVYRIVDGRAKQANVRPGTRIAMHVEILEGLDVGDLVVTAGQQRLADGVAVIPREPTFVPPSPPDEEIQIIDQ